MTGAQTRRGVVRSGAASARTPDTSACVFRHITRTSRSVSAVYDEALAPAGLTANQFNLMMTLHQVGPQAVMHLAQILGMEPSGIPRAVKPLSAREFVYVRAGKDRRQRIIGLTAGGRSALLAAVPAWAGVQARIIQQFGSRNWQTTTVKLSRLRVLVRKQSASTSS
jgi:DNA-binding MarR family transcriptional regulator